MKRRKFTAAFKRKVVLEALRGDETVRSIASRHGVHPNQVSKWKTEAHEGLLEVFARRQGQVGGPGEGAADRDALRADRRVDGGAGFFFAGFGALGRIEKVRIIREDGTLSLSRKCDLAGVSRSSLYYEPRPLDGAPSGASVAGGSAVHAVPVLRHAAGEPAPAPGGPRRGPGPGAHPDGGGELAHGASGAAHLQAPARPQDIPLSAWRP